MTAAKLVRLYEEANGSFEDTRLTIDIPDLCDTVPAVGDLISSPWTATRVNRSDYTNREIFEVVKRYFLPNDDEEHYYVALVVKRRPAERGESGIVIAN